MTSTQTENWPALSRELPYVSVIIPVYNDTERLLKCLAALEQQTYPTEAYEVIVIDNASKQSVASVVKQFKQFKQATCIYEAQPGSYVARNRGLELAKGSVFAFTDSDCIPATDWLLQGVKKLIEAPEYGLVGGRIDLMFHDEARPTAIELYEMLWAFRQDVYVSTDGFSATANLLARRETFDKAGPFNAGLKSGGDREWCGRAVKAGHVLAYADAASVRHPARRTYAELSNKVLRISGGRFDRLRRGADKNARVQVREMLWELRPPFRAIGRIWGSDRTGDLASRMRVLGIVMLVRYLTAYERARLLLGGKSRR